MKRKASRPPALNAAVCYCGAPALITVGLRDLGTTWGDVDRDAYCLAHLEDAITAIAVLRLELEAAQ